MRNAYLPASRLAFCLCWLIPLSTARAQVLQLPSIDWFSINTSVMVPDRGGVSGRCRSFPAGLDPTRCAAEPGPLPGPPRREPGSGWQLQQQRQQRPCDDYRSSRVGSSGIGGGRPAWCRCRSCENPATGSGRILGTAAGQRGGAAGGRPVERGRDPAAQQPAAGPAAAAGRAIPGPGPRSATARQLGGREDLLADGATDAPRETCSRKLPGIWPT